jgi:hypothetical protein
MSDSGFRGENEPTNVMAGRHADLRDKGSGQSSEPAPAGNSRVSPHAPALSKWRWLTAIRAFAKGGGSAISLVFSGLALVISYLSYQHTLNFDSSTAFAHQIAQQKTYANKVSYSTDSGGGRVEVQNRSKQTISNIMVEVQPASHEPNVPAGAVTLVGLGSLKACSVMIADVSNAARLYLVGYGVGWVQPGGVPGLTFPMPGPPSSLASAQRTVQHLERIDGFQVSIKSLIFKDANGLQWIRINGRPLQSSTVISYVGTAPGHKVRRLVGCS